MAWAWMVTPGTLSPSVVLWRSSRPEAEVPTSTMLPAIRSVKLLVVRGEEDIGGRDDEVLARAAVVEPEVTLRGGRHGEIADADAVDIAFGSGSIAEDDDGVDAERDAQRFQRQRG